MDEQRGIPVHALEQRVVACARLGFAGPDDDARLARAAFVERRFAAAQRQIARGRDVREALRVGGFRRIREAAVVGEEDDDRALGDARLVHRREQAAHAVVEALDHRGIERVVLRVLRIGLRLEVLDVVLGAFHGECTE